MYKYCANLSGPTAESEPIESSQNEQVLGLSAGSDRTDLHAPRMQAWERLAYKFSNNSSSTSESDATTVEEEFRQYSTSMLPKLGSIESLKFWHVSITHIPGNGIVITLFHAGKRKCISYPVCNGNGLSSHSVLSSPMRASILF